MRKYVIKKLLLAVLTIFLVMTLNFALVHAAPGNPVDYMIGMNTQNIAQRNALIEKFGLNDPVPVQYVRMLRQYLQGDLGTSIVYSRPVVEMIGEKIGSSFTLIITATVLSLILGTVMGMVSARKEGSFLDGAFSGVNYVFNAMPGFWVGLMLIIIFATKLGLFPTSGMVDMRAGYTGFRRILDIMYHMALPVMALIAVDVPYFFRIAKSSVLQVNSEEFITTYRAAGMSEQKIFRKFVLKNAMLPIVTVFGIQMAYLLSGVVLIEIVYAWPGTGRLMQQAIMARDYPMLMGFYLIMSIMIAVTMIVVDIIYAALDPRIRY